VNSCVYECTVAHSRFSPVKNQFVYRSFFFCLDLSELEELERKFSLFGWNRFRLFSLRDEDHFRFDPERNMSLDACARQAFHDAGYQPGKILLITNLRIFGYVFNPVSFYICYSKGQAAAALLEVNNTYGEQKKYIIDLEKGASDELRKKLFYVSPFIDFDTDFRFRIQEPGEELHIRIDSLKEGRVDLKSALRGKRREITNRFLAGLLFRYPLQTLRIIFLIHYQAFRLYLKKVPYFPKLETDKKIREFEAKEINSEVKERVNVP